VSKTKNLLDVLGLLGIGEDLKRVEQSIKKRSGKAKRRGRPNRIGKSALIVVGHRDCELLKLNNSIPGIGIKYVKDISVLDLAPGARPIRLVVFSQNSIDELSTLKIPKNVVLENSI
jgi:large subunit ribosomal protein L4e